MKLKELKSKIVVAMAAPFIQEHGIKSMNPRNPNISVWVGQLHMMLWSAYSEKPYQRLDIWDHSIGKKVFSAGIAPLVINRCDTGKWFDLFMSSFALQASMSIERYLETKADLSDVLPGANSTRMSPAVSLASSPANSITK